MKYFLGCVLLLFVTSSVAEEVKRFRIDGVIQPSTIDDVRKVIDEVETKQLKKVVLGIISPGGEAISGFTVARMLRKLSNKGVIVEIHAFGLCASACTWILASGTPGYRFVDKYTFVLIHPVQNMKNGEMSCMSTIKDPKTVEDRINNLYLQIAKELYMEFTGHAAKTVEEWMTCGREQAGEGQLLITLGMADKLDD